MSYITQLELVSRYGETELIQLTDPDMLAIDADIIAVAIADADAEIDAYLAGRMALPLATVPAALTRIAAVMVRYYLYRDNVTELIADQYKSAIKFLDAVAKGHASIGPSTAGDEVSPPAAPSWSSSDSTFSTDEMSGF